MLKITRSVLVKGKYEKRDYNSENNMKNLTNHGIFDSASNSIANSYTIPYALALNATNAEIGLLNFMKNFATTAAQIPGAMMTERFSRKSLWIFSAISSRLFWIPIILVPLLNLSVTALILFLALATFLWALNAPAWTSIAGDIVPESERGRYFGKRNFLIGLSGLIATMVAGVLVYYGFPLIFSISIILGLFSTIFFMRIHEPKFKKKFIYKYSFSLDLKGIKNGIVINKDLAIFTVFLMFMNFAVNVAAPFFAVYQLRDLNVGYIWFAVIVSFSVLTTIVFQPYWGRLNDRFGERKIIAANGILICFVPFFYLFVSSPWHILLVEFFSSFAWSGFDLATFNLLLSLTPQEKRPEYVANHRFFISIGAMFGSLSGGLIAESLKDSRFLFLYGLQIIFLISFILRISTLILLTRIRGIEKKPVEYFLYRSIAIEPVRSVSHTLYTLRFERLERLITNAFRRIYYKIKMLRT